MSLSAKIIPYKTQIILLNNVLQKKPTNKQTNKTKQNIPVHTESMESTFHWGSLENVGKALIGYPRP